MQFKLRQGVEAALLKGGAVRPEKYTTRKDVLFTMSQLAFYPEAANAGAYEAGSMAHELGKRGLAGLVDEKDDMRQPRYLLIFVWREAEGA